MEPNEPRGPEPPPLPALCQSCGMPMGRKGDFGTNADGTLNREYCVHCYESGKFREPGLTLERMVEKMASMASMMNMSEDEAREIANKVLPKLKRWRKPPKKR